WGTTSRRTSAAPPGSVSAHAGSPRRTAPCPREASSRSRHGSVAFPTSKGCWSSVHGLILAGGEGSRLAAGGIRVPKPLVEVAGRVPGDRAGRGRGGGHGTRCDAVRGRRVSCVRDPG